MNAIYEEKFKNHEEKFKKNEEKIKKIKPFFFYRGNTFIKRL